MLFQIITSDTGEALPNLTFASAAEAQAARPIYEIETGRKLRIAKVTTYAWRLREEHLAANGTRKPLPTWWQESPWWSTHKEIHKDHFAHMSVKHEGKIAFTESPEKGEANIQTPISVSRYLARFFADHLRPEDISAIAARFEAGEVQVKIASTPDAFQDVYRRAINVCAENTSARSCMHGRFSHLPHHPAYVYGAGDLAIAWIEREDAVIARAVIWPERKTFVRLYGNTKTECQALRVYLEDEGYNQEDHFEGARLLKIAARSEYLMPYIDASDDEYKTCEDMGDHFIIAYDGGVDATNTNGLCEYSSGICCESCGDRIGRHDSQYEVQGEIWCETCHDNDTFYCDYTEELYPNSQGSNTVIVRRMREETWNSESTRNNAFSCEHTNAFYSSDDFTQIEVTTTSGTKTWCEEATRENFFEDTNGDYFSGYDFTQIDVTQTGGQTEIYCLEKPASEIFLCEACDTYHVIEMQDASDLSMCQECALNGARPTGKIQDEAQTEIAL